MFRQSQEERLEDPGLSSVPYRRHYQLRAPPAAQFVELKTSTFARVRKIEPGKVGRALGRQQRAGWKAGSPRELEEQAGEHGAQLQPWLPREGARGICSLSSCTFPNRAAPTNARGAVTAPGGHGSALHAVLALAPCPASLCKDRKRRFSTSASLFLPTPRLLNIVSLDSIYTYICVCVC